MLTLATLAGQLTVFLVMLVSLRVCGVTASEVTLIEAFAAWSLARLLGSLPITPGGIGIVEVGPHRASSSASAATTPTSSPPC